MRQNQTEEQRRVEKMKKISSHPQFQIAVSVDTENFNETENEQYIYHNFGSIFEQEACEHCHAYRWPHPLELPHFCCKDGKVLESVQSYQDPPKPLCTLLQDKHFCDIIRHYNNALVFASLVTDQAAELSKMYQFSQGL